MKCTRRGRLVMLSLIFLCGAVAARPLAGQEQTAGEEPAGEEPAGQEPAGQEPAGSENEGVGGQEKSGQEQSWLRNPARQLPEKPTREQLAATLLDLAVELQMIKLLLALTLGLAAVNTVLLLRRPDRQRDAAADREQPLKAVDVAPPPAAAEDKIDRAEAPAVVPATPAVVPTPPAAVTAAPAAVTAAPTAVTAAPAAVTATSQRPRGSAPAERMQTPASRVSSPGAAAVPGAPGPTMQQPPHIQQPTAVDQELALLPHGAVAQQLSRLHREVPGLARQFTDARLRDAFLAHLDKPLPARIERFRQTARDPRSLAEQWVEQDLVTTLNSLAQFLSKAIEERRHGRLGNRRLEEALQDWLYERLAPLCEQAGWFQVEPILPYQTLFNPQRHQGIGQVSLDGVNNPVVVAIETIGRRDPRSSYVTSKAEVVVGR